MYVTYHSRDSVLFLCVHINLQTNDLTGRGSPADIYNQVSNNKEIDTVHKFT